MRPNFQMRSDSCEPGIETCTGYWSFPGGGEVTLRFQTGKECMAMNDFIQAAYDQGFNAGRREVKMLMEQALKKIC